MMKSQGRRGIRASDKQTGAISALVSSTRELYLLRLTFAARYSVLMVANSFYLIFILFSLSPLNESRGPTSHHVSIELNTFMIPTNISLHAKKITNQLAFSKPTSLIKNKSISHIALKIYAYNF